MTCVPFPERNGYEHIEDESRVRRIAAIHPEIGSSPEVSPEITPPRQAHDNSSSENQLSSPEGGSPLMIGTLPPPPPRGYGTAAAAGALAGVVAGASSSRAGSSGGNGNGNGNGNGGKRGSRTSMTVSSVSPGTEGSEAASVSVVADHYSTNAIVQQSEVVALWSYTPRLADEMGLERGDVVRIENLYDDGWALGRKLRTKVWDLGDERSTERDSGLGTSHRESTSTVPEGGIASAPGEKPASRGTTSRSSEKDKGKDKEETGSIKAFPMVCVCHRDAWAEVRVSFYPIF